MKKVIIGILIAVVLLGVIIIGKGIGAYNSIVGQKTPSITELTIDYTELPLPLPPFSVKAVAGNEKVTISWSYSVDDTVGGYYLYYGTRPGEYLGRVALEGESPINVGNSTSYTLTGLQNGKIYYFAIASWSKFDDKVVGNFSKEVYARPLERLK